MSNDALPRSRKRTEARRVISELISEQALWGQQLPTDRELSSRLGIGRWTIQAALAELEAKGVVERRQGSGTFVAEQAPNVRAERTRRVAIVAARPIHEVPRWSYEGEMVRGALKLASRTRTSATVLCFGREKDRSVLESTSELRRFGGFVLLGLQPLLIDRRFITRLLALEGRPVVLLDDTLRDLPVISVVDGSFEGMRAVTRHVIRRGHRRLGFLDCHNRDAINPEKFAGYGAALQEAGLPVDPALVAIPRRRALSDLRPDSEFCALVESDVNRLLDLRNPPTAIVAFDDNYALAAMRALERRGLSAGTNFCLAGHGDAAIRKGLCDRLTSCRTYPRKMGEAAVRAALEPKPRGEARTIIVPNRLYVRRSTCPAAQPE